MVDFPKIVQGLVVLARVYRGTPVTIFWPGPADAQAATLACNIIDKVAADPALASAFAAGVTLGQSLGLKGSTP